MDKFYVTLTYGENLYSVSFHARDISHALQRMTDFFAGANWRHNTVTRLSIESISLTAKRGVTYEEGWL